MAKQLVARILDIQSPVVSKSTSHVIGDNIYIITQSKIEVFNTLTNTFGGSISLSNTTQEKTSYLYLDRYIYISYTNPTTETTTNRKKINIDRYDTYTSTYVAKYYTIAGDYYPFDEYGAMFYVDTGSRFCTIRGVSSSTSSTSQSQQNTYKIPTSSTQGTASTTYTGYNRTFKLKGQPFTYNDLLYVANSNVSNPYMMNFVTTAKAFDNTFALPSTIDKTMIKSFIYNNEIYLVDNLHFYKVNMTGQSVTIIPDFTTPISLGECYANIKDDKVYFFNPTGQIVLVEFTEYNNKYEVLNTTGERVYYESTDDNAPLSSVRFDYNEETKQVDISLFATNKTLFSAYTHEDSENSYLKGFSFNPNSLVVDIDLNYTKIIEDTTSINFYEVLGYYTNQYEVFNNDGTITYFDTGERKAPIRKIEFQRVPDSNDIKIILTTSIDETVYTYTPVIPDGFELIGFNNVPSSVVVTYEIGASYGFETNESISFYEVYVAKIPSFKGFGLVLYKNSSEKIRVDKSRYLTMITTIEGTLREECDIINPTILLQYNTLPNFNYVYIPIYGRYYFLSNIVSVKNGLWRISLNCDVLMSYKDIIRNQTGMILRQEKSYNSDIPDDIKPAISKKEVHTLNSNNYVFYPNQLANEGEDSFYRFLFGVVSIYDVE